MLRATRITFPTLPSQLGSPPLTLLLTPAGDLTSPIALRVRKLFPADLSEEFLQAGTYPWDTQTQNTSSISLTGAPRPTLSTARMVHDLLWQQWRETQSACLIPCEIARCQSNRTSKHFCVRACLCVRARVHVCRCLWAPGSHMAADWRQKLASHKFIFWQSMDGGRDKHSLSAHAVTLSPSLDKPNLLKAQNVCAAGSSSALMPLDQLAWGQLWVQQLGQKGWWRTMLYLEICIIIFWFNLWTFGFWGPDPELWACLPCTAL